MVLTLTEITTLLLTYRYLFLFPIVVIEGPIITVIAGFYISLGVFNPFLTYLVVVLGDLTGDVIFYYLGYYGRKRFLDRWGHYFGATPERVERLTEKMRANAGKVLLTGKTIEGTGALVQATAGLAQVPFRKFIWYDTIPTVLKSFLYLLIGFYFGQAYNEIARYFDYASAIAVAAVIIFIAVYLVITKRVMKKIKVEQL